MAGYGVCSVGENFFRIHLRQIKLFKDQDQTQDLHPEFERKFDVKTPTLAMDTLSELFF